MGYRAGVITILALSAIGCSSSDEIAQSTRWYDSDLLDGTAQCDLVQHCTNASDPREGVRIDLGVSTRLQCLRAADRRNPLKYEPPACRWGAEWASKPVY